MKKRTQWIALLAALAMVLTLLAGCGEEKDGDAPQTDSPALTDQQPETPPDPQPAEPAPDEGQPAEPAPDNDPPSEPAPDTDTPSEPAPDEGQPAGQQPQQPAEDPSEPPEDPKPSDPAPEQPPQEEQQPQEQQPQQSDGLADGTYTVAVTLEGGSGRAGVESPCSLRCEGGQMWATIVWSSSNYDYMKVDGEKYELVSAAGENSAFEIPVAALDQALPVIADTVAMSTPHEVEYTLTFDSATLTQS